VLIWHFDHVCSDWRYIPYWSFTVTFMSDTTRHCYQCGLTFLFKNSKADFFTSVFIDGNSVVTCTDQ